MLAVGRDSGAGVADVADAEWATVLSAGRIERVGGAAEAREASSADRAEAVEATASGSAATDEGGFACPGVSPATAEARLVSAGATGAGRVSIHVAPTPMARNPTAMAATLVFVNGMGNSSKKVDMAI